MRAIICDDDEIILRGLRSVIDWASLGIEPVSYTHLTLPTNSLV